MNPTEARKVIGELIETKQDILGRFRDIATRRPLELSELKEEKEIEETLTALTLALSALEGLSIEKIKKIIEKYNSDDPKFSKITWNEYVNEFATAIHQAYENDRER